MEKSDLRRIAAANGLTRLTESHLDQLAASIRSNDQLSQRLPKDLHWTEECAHVYRFPASREGKR